MEKEINFGEGIRLTPYSDVSPDGEMNVCHNLELHGGGLRPSVIEGRKYQVSSTIGVLSHIHATGEYTHLIFIKDDEIYWVDEADDEHRHYQINADAEDKTIQSVTSVGNVLVFTTATDTLYALWQSNTYQWMGAIPELSVEWSLIGTYKRIRAAEANSTAENLNVEPWYTTGGPSGDIDYMMGWGPITYNRMAIAMRAFEEKYCNCENGRFVHPFLVRAAFRLYDGSTWTKHTPAVLMTPNQDMPILGVRTARMRDYANLFGCICALQAYINGGISQEWKQVISAVDIFVSLPLDPWEYTWNESYNDELVHYRELNIGTDSWISGVYGKYEFGRITLGIDEGDTAEVLGYYALKHKNSSALTEQGETAEFYRIASIPIGEIISIPTGRRLVKEIRMEKGVYENLMQQPRLPDDYASHDTIGADVSYTYNKRVTLGGLTKQVFVGDRIDRCMNYLTYEEPGTTPREVAYRFLWKREKDGVVSYHDAGEATCRSYVKKIRYLYVPDPHVTALVVIDPVSTGNGTVTGQKAELTMKEHPFMEGSYFYDRDGRELTFSTETSTIDISGRPQEELKSSLMTSSAANPFKFGAEGWNEVGNGRVLSLVSITTALSEGQFGQFPLMALCTDGNYALEVIKSGEYAGLYGGVSAMPRDVCVNRKSVTQTDNAILFVSNRGVMIADGNNIRCISESLNGPADASLSLNKYGEDVYEGTGQKLRDFFEGCQIVWDYTSQRALFFNPQIDIVFQWKDNSWSSMTPPYSIRAVQNVYPYSYIQTASSITVLDDDYNFHEKEHESGYIETRPIKMDTLQLKKLNEISIQGRFRDVQEMSLYGSNDMVTWHWIGTTTRRRVPHIVGRWFKYWRVLVKTNLRENEHISGLRLRYDVRQETRVR